MKNALAALLLLYLADVPHRLKDNLYVLILLQRALFVNQNTDNKC